MNKAIFILGALLVLGCNEKNSVEPTNENVQSTETQDSLTTGRNGIPLIIPGTSKNSRALINCGDSVRVTHQSVKDSLFFLSRSLEGTRCEVLVTFDYFNQPFSRPTPFTVGKDSLLEVKAIPMNFTEYPYNEEVGSGWITEKDTLFEFIGTDSFSLATEVSVFRLEKIGRSSEDEGLEFFRMKPTRFFYANIDSNVYDFQHYENSMTEFYILDHKAQKSHHFLRYFGFETRVNDYNELKERTPDLLTDSLLQNYGPRSPYSLTTVNQEGDTIHHEAGITHVLGADSLAYRFSYFAFGKGAFCEGEYPNISLYWGYFNPTVKEEDHLCVGQYENDEGATVYFRLPRFRIRGGLLLD